VGNKLKTVLQYSQYQCTSDTQCDWC